MNPDGFDTGAGDAVPDNPEIDTPAADAPDVFDGLVLDEAFVLAALIHEPSAEERLKALRVGARRRGRAVAGPQRYDHGGVSLSAGITVRRGRYQTLPGRWQRVVARVMLVVIGLLAVLVAAAAVYRGASPTDQQAPRSGTGAGGSASSPSSGAAGSSVAGIQR